MKIDFKKLVLESVDLEKLAFSIIDEVLEEALKEVVAKSENKFDDAALALVYPILEVEVKKLIAAKVAELKA